MFQEPRNNFSLMRWQPTISLAHLKQRAKFIKDIRSFFETRHILEVETPLLAPHTVTEPSIQSIPAQLSLFSRVEKYPELFYLQTSPEYAMKRLLASGSGDIFQLCKAFRQEEIGKIHQPEFTILEWYRIGFTDFDLMKEVDEFLQMVADAPPCDFVSYQELFLTDLACDPHQATLTQLQKIAKNAGFSWENSSTPWNRDDYLQALMSICIEPHLGKSKPICIYDFPASQAALARLDEHQPHLAKRFEFYWKGLELANGFYELNDAQKQRQRFLDNNQKRAELGLPQMAIDEYLLQALEQGLPDCAGVALGVDRLFMILTGCERIQEVVSFGME